MYKYIPQKKRSKLRIAIGVLFYTTLRYFYWLKYHSHFTKLTKTQKHINKICGSQKDLSIGDKQFPFTAYYASSELYRNLSKNDTAMQNAKVENLLIAIKKINGVIIKPGQIFSYWRLIGNPTKFKGYKKGMMLVDGVPTARTGGGLCALSNIIYWITLHTPLSVIERYRHSYDVFPDSNRTRPFASGATCVYNYRDLMIKNETQNTYKLKLEINQNRLEATWLCLNEQKEKYEIIEKDHHFTEEGPGIFVRHNKLYRHRLDIKTDDELITENHAITMYRPLLPVV